MKFNTIEDSEDLVGEVKRQVKISARKSSTLFSRPSSPPPIGLHLIRRKTLDAGLIKLHLFLYDTWTMASIVSELPVVYHNESTAPGPKFRTLSATLGTFSLTLMRRHTGSPLTLALADRTHHLALFKIQ
jgi:hypothetical protein